MVYAVYTQWHDIFNDLSPNEQRQATLDLFAYGMFAIDKSMGCLVDPKIVRIKTVKIEPRPERKYLLLNKRVNIQIDPSIFRRTDPGHCG